MKESPVVCLLPGIDRYLLTLDILFRQITTIIKVHVAFVFGLQTLELIDFTKIFQFKGLKPQKKRQHEL